MTTLRNAILLPTFGFTYLAVHGCTPIEGGAVEVSWDLRTFGGLDIRCDQANVAEVRLWWEVERTSDEGGTTLRFDVFPCNDERGVTGFDLPAGTASLWLSPVCEGEVVPMDGTYRSPAPIVRTITEGDVITLDTQILEIDSGSVCP